MAQAFITIHCLNSKESNVMLRLEEIPEVIDVDRVIENYEIICRIAAPTYNDFSDIISKKIRKIPRIKSTITSNIINNQGFNK